MHLSESYNAYTVLSRRSIPPLLDPGICDKRLSIKVK